jgi:hypothetical protein
MNARRFTVARTVNADDVQVLMSGARSDLV